MEETTRYRPETSWSERHKEPEQENYEEAVFFTLLRQTGKQVSQISFALKSHCYHSLAMHDLEEIYFQPTKGILLFFRQATVQVLGQNLQKLYQLLTQRRVLEIREFSETAGIFFDTDALFITSMIYESDNLQSVEW